MTPTEQTMASKFMQITPSQRRRVQRRARELFSEVLNGLRSDEKRLQSRKAYRALLDEYQVDSDRMLNASSLDGKFLSWNRP